MTAGTRVMRLICTAGQRGIGMAAAAGGTGHGDDAGMIRGGGMRRLPVTGMTGGTVAAYAEALAYRGADQPAGGVMAAGTRVMGISGSAGQGIIMTVGTGGRGYLNQCTMIRSRCMRVLPGIGMTRRAVTRCITDSQAD